MRRSSAGGFTLIEMLVTIVIIGIIAAIALPSYTEHIRKSQRANAKAIMVETAQFMERYYTVNNTYAGAALLSEFAPKGTNAGSGRYQLAFTGARDAVNYTLEATPLNDQLDDKCGILTIDSKGVQGAEAAGCW